jgi:hypothetical protein
MAAVVELVENVIGAVGKAVTDVVDFIDPQKLVDAVSGVASNIFKPIENIFEAVGDVVESAVEFVGNVIEKVGNVVQKVIDDPLPVLLSIAGAAVGIPPYVTMGVITAAKGGNLEDVVLSMGTAYLGSSVTSGVGSSISSTVSSTFIEAGLNETFSVVAGDAISKGLVNGTIAEIKGGNFGDGFAGGFTGGLVAGGVAEVASYVQPSVISLAMDSGLNLADATSVFNAGIKAVSAGVTSEITGKGDFVTSFANSAIGSAIDAGTRSISAAIDTQFETAATGWDEKSKDKIDTTVTGAGIPDTLVAEVKVSDTGVETSTSTIDAVLADTKKSDVTTAASDTAVLPVTKAADTQAALTSTAGTADAIVSQAPAAETTAAFQDLISTKDANSAASVDTSVNLPKDVVDIAEKFPEEAVVSGVPTGALASVSDNIVFNDASETPSERAAVSTTSPLASVSETLQPINLSNFENQGSEVIAPASENLLVSSPEATVKLPALASMSDTEQPLPVVKNTKDAVLSEAAIPENLLIKTSPADTTEEQPVGGLNAVSAEPPQEKITSGLKATGIAKPVISTIGSAIKSALNRKPTTARPVGGLQATSIKPKVVKPPVKMDVSKLIPIQKAAPIKTTVGPAKTLASTAKLSPVSNIAGLTSLVKKAG